jgi:hypothetical protein
VTTPTTASFQQFSVDQTGARHEDQYPAFVGVVTNKLLLHNTYPL